MGDVSELTLLLLRIFFIILLWGFLFALIYAIRSDLFGGAVRKLAKEGRDDGPKQQKSPRLPFTTEAQPVVPAAGPGSAMPSARPDAVTEQVSAVGAGWKPGAPAGATARLVITSGPKAGQELPLGRDPLTIGRSSDSGLVIRDEYTSTHHARLMLWGEQWMLQDLDSTNGTFLDGARVTVPTPVDFGATIRVGTTTFELRA